MGLLRVVFVGLVLAVATAVAIDIGRPKMLHNKLAARKATLGDSGSAAQAHEATEQIEHLRVAAAERETSLADQFAMDLDAHVAAKEAAVAGGQTDATVEAESVVSTDTSGAVEAEVVTGSDAEIVIEMADGASTATETEAEEEAETEAEESSESESESEGEGEGGLAVELLQDLEFQQTAATSGTKRTFATEKIKWSNCAYTSNAKAAPAAAKAKPAKKTKKVKAAKVANNGQTRLTSVTLKPASLLRDQSFVVEIEGVYTGPDVTYGSVTLQIARGETLAYRHSLLLSDVITFNPLRSGAALSTTLYVPEAAFNMYAPHGDYVLTVVFTNQDKLPFACARVDFKLD